ncbi:hypothetical protein [Streptomyces sp. NPDC048295]|uniref:hypothetical protein n=1 Tax=Streptomyces sp. NPDC048295 TaxID=3154617 RepID=UPI00344A75E1
MVVLGLPGLGAGLAMRAAFTIGTIGVLAAVPAALVMRDTKAEPAAEEAGPVPRPPRGGPVSRAGRRPSSVPHFRTGRKAGRSVRAIR